MTTTGTQAWVSLAERLPAFTAYEVSHRGKVRSIDRTLPDGRKIRGRELKAGVSGTSPYPQVDLYDAAGNRRTFSVHSLVLLAYVGECPDGQEALHFNDNPLDNRWPENLGYGTHPENVVQRMLNRPAAPKPPKLCVRCGGEFAGNGKRCHECVLLLSALAARALAEGGHPDGVAKDLDYPSAGGLVWLAIRHGGLRLSLPAAEPEPAAPRQWLQSVTATLRARFGRGDAT